MAANFWHSAHFKKWIIDQSELELATQQDLKYLTKYENIQMKMFYTNVLQAIGKTLKLRQQVISTAMVFYRRFYSRNSVQICDPVLLVATAVYLASKVEECGTVAAKNVVHAARVAAQSKEVGFGFTDGFEYDSEDIVECEFYLLEELDCYLIVFHPYRPLIQFAQDAQVPHSVLTNAWFIVNDTYRTDLCLLYPPYLIALACMYMACVELDGEIKDMKQWFAELSVNMEEVLEIVQVILELYGLWEEYEKTKHANIPKIIKKAAKPKVEERPKKK
eukprot:Nk52_evm10s2192 gene=Nk52_evmTU10s2192